MEHFLTANWAERSSRVRQNAGPMSRKPRILANAATKMLHSVARRGNIVEHCSKGKPH